MVAFVIAATCANIAVAIAPVSGWTAGTTTQTLLIAVPPLYIKQELLPITVWVTAYSSTPEETDSTPFITASNTRVRDGVVAANFLPFGTEIKIPSLFGDKIFIVEDRMSPFKKNVVDIWMPSKERAIKFGAQRAEVFVLPQS